MKTHSDAIANLPTLRYWLALLRIPGIGPAKFAALLENFPNLASVFSSPTVLAKYGIEFLKPDWQGVDLDLAWQASSSQHHIITWQDERYPALLLQTVNPPPILFVNGDAAVLSQLQLAIVGSRNPTPTGIAITLDFARQLSNSGLVITSGLALGIDAAAHRGALAAKGKTIAVLGTGLDNIYPKQHQELAIAIAQQGALVSEFPMGMPALPENFPRRNRVVSGMSLGTLVTEATLRSGSLITARLANEQNREVFAVPGSIHNPLSRGCHTLIKQGAKMVESASDILDELAHFRAVTHLPDLWHNRELGSATLGFGGHKTPDSPVTEQPSSQPESNKKIQQQTFPVAGTHLKLLECVGFEITTIDRIVELSGYSVSEVASMLLILELRGYIIAVSGGFLRVTT